jgi:hypothetical protein
VMGHTLDVTDGHSTGSKRRHAQGYQMFRRLFASQPPGYRVRLTCERRVVAPYCGDSFCAGEVCAQPRFWRR